MPTSPSDPDPGLLACPALLAAALRFDVAVNRLRVAQHRERVIQQATRLVEAQTETLALVGRLLAGGPAG